MKQKKKILAIFALFGLSLFFQSPVLADVANVTIDAQPNPFNKVGDRIIIAAGLKNYPACTGNVLIQFALYIDNQIIKTAPWGQQEPVSIFQTTKNSHRAKATFWCGTTDLNQAVWSQSSNIVTISQTPASSAASVQIQATPNPFQKVGDKITVTGSIADSAICPPPNIIKYAVYFDGIFQNGSDGTQFRSEFLTNKNVHGARGEFWCGTGNITNALWQAGSDIVITQVSATGGSTGSGNEPPGSTGSGNTSTGSTGSGNEPPAGLTNPAPGQLVNIDTFEKLLLRIINIFLYFAGGIAVIFIVVGGFQYVASRGNEESTEKAKKTVTYAVLGLVIIVMAFAIVSIVNNLLIREPPQNVGRDFINLV